VASFLSLPMSSLLRTLQASYSTFQKRPKQRDLTGNTILRKTDR
jgi:hypothetical protein